MKTFSQLRTYLNDLPLVSEELHATIQHVLDSDTIPVQNKFNHVTKSIRGAIARGEDTGLHDSKPKKGSSRAVYFPKDEHHYQLDGKPAKSTTALKVAFPGQLDKYNKSGALLGEHQNMVEGDHHINHEHGILSEVGHNQFETNHHYGVLAPVFHAHDEGHHVLMGKIDPIKAGDFKNLTKTKEFPKGISHEEFHDTLQHHYAQAHGQRHYGATSKERMSELEEHPLVEKFTHYVGNTGAHPGDLNKRNMGIWTHPHTGEKHIVASDFGFNGDVMKHYSDARQNMMKQKRGW